LKATSPGQYIHSTFGSINTIKNGEIIVIVTVDNYSQLAFGPNMIREHNFYQVAKHIYSLIQELRKKYKNIMPVIYLSYAEEYIDRLAVLFDVECTIEYNPTIANKIALPLLESLLNKISR
jgi:hypothetical protein